MKLADVLTQSAILTAKAGVTVERFHGSQLVVFKQNGKEFATLQGDEANKFNDECMTTYNEIFFIWLGFGNGYCRIGTCRTVFSSFGEWQMKRLYNIVVIVDKTQQRIIMSAYPDTYEHCCTIMSKMTKYKWRTIILEEVKS